MPAAMSRTGKMVRTDEENAEVLIKFFVSVFTGNLSFSTSFKYFQMGTVISVVPVVTGEGARILI